MKIRRFIPSDAPAIFAYSREESTHRELPDEVFDSLEEVEGLLPQFNSNADTGDYPIVLCVALSENDYPVGHVSLSPLTDTNIEIGYAIGEAYQGKGYGCLATRLFSDWALKEGGYSRLFGIVKETNPASIRCLEKAGYHLICREERDCFGGRYPIREYVREAE